MSHLQPGEWEEITDLHELNDLYAMKVREELAEIQRSGHNDVKEFADLVDVAYAWAKANGFSEKDMAWAIMENCSYRGPRWRKRLKGQSPWAY